MSIISRMRELESFDDASLVNMIQQGNARYPQYAVLGEIQRREDLRRITKNQIAMQNRPTMTVADETVMQFSQGAMPVNTANLTSNKDVPATPAGLQGVAPTMMMEDGGITQMQSGRSTALEQSFDNPLNQESSNSFLDSLKKRYVNPDGTFNTAQIAKDGLSTALVASYFTPAGAIRGGLGLLGRGAMSLFKPFTAAGREGIKRSVGRQAAKINPKMVRDPKTGKFRSQAEIGSKAIGSVAKPLGLTAGVGILQAPDGDTSTITQDNVGLTDAEKNAASSLQDLQNILGTPTDSTADTSREDSINTGLNIAQLAGVIGTARNLGEIAGGMGQLAGQIQRQRTAKRELDAKLKLTDTQIKKLESDIANIPLDAALTQYAAIPKLLETGAIEQADAIKLLESLNKRIAELQGITPTQSKSYDQFITSA
tara:strand:+ start:534 stop:1814 length:1281 start_codon:yes stop_codon:yes gene_type:complete